jgi:predicted nuclease of predicted toxin-antitoxin system
VKFKLDENFGTRTQGIFKEAGHEVHTVRQESLQGTPDEQLYEVCRAEERCLVTLDLDFANVIRFPPDQPGGIVVVRIPRNPSLPVLEQLVQQFLKTLDRISVENKLWIVEMGRVRVHQSDAEDV